MERQRTIVNVFEFDSYLCQKLAFLLRVSIFYSSDSAGDNEVQKSPGESNLP